MYLYAAYACAWFIFCACIEYIIVLPYLTIFYLKN